MSSFINLITMHIMSFSNRITIASHNRVPIMTSSAVCGSVPLHHSICRLSRPIYVLHVDASCSRLFNHFLSLLRPSASVSAYSPGISVRLSIVCLPVYEVSSPSEICIILIHHPLPVRALSVTAHISASTGIRSIKSIRDLCHLDPSSTACARLKRDSTYQCVYLYTKYHVHPRSVSS
ncbi:hypothetical protein BCR43DRAFT_495853 [Syncephalastrum racemosum]|uniref:Uncharacterized protein n=1 Tax=Syncephalastrum racemosum TaxID=13706 RepID=A0A1X2H7U0_SYNRA|nr:hypothetical protein BCR43DRAFT_495853 [Syncephalastrum racemosum]